MIDTFLFFPMLCLTICTDFGTIQERRTPLLLPFRYLLFTLALYNLDEIETPLDKASRIHLLEKSATYPTNIPEQLAWEISSVRGNMTDSSESLDGNPIPQLSELRRAPMRYRHILPLPIVKRYQCLVIGAAKGELTIAITDTQKMEVLESLSRYTGKTIFPVFIDPKRMHLLIQRIERRELCRRSPYAKRNQAKGSECYQYTLQRLQIRSILMLITSQNTRGS